MCSINKKYFYLKYHECEILVDICVITKAGYFYSLLNFYAQQDIYFGLKLDIYNNDNDNNDNDNNNRSHSILDISEILDHYSIELNGRIDVKIIGETLRVIIDILYNKTVNLHSLEHNLTYLVQLMDYFQVPVTSLDKLVEKSNIYVWQQYYNIYTHYNKDNLKDNDIITGIQHYIRIMNTLNNDSEETTQLIIDEFMFILKHIRFLAKTPDLYGKYYNQINNIIKNSTCINIEAILIFKIIRQVLENKACERIY